MPDATPGGAPRVAAVVVDYGHHETIGRTLASLRGQSRAPARIVVVANHPERRVLPVVAEAAPGATVVLPEANLGFAGGCNAGAAAASDVDWLFFLNPDSEARPDCLEHLLAVAAAQPRAAVLGAQVLLPDGRTNAGDNGVHPSGIVWAGRLYEPVEDGPDRPALALSGAALLVRRDCFDALGGFCARYFTYHEDVELCWRARLAGWDVRFCPAARVVHDYAFEGKHAKWRHMERNRHWLVLSAYERRTLLLLVPLLAAAEAGVLLAAARGGWLAEKRAAYGDVWRERRWLAGRRRAVQRLRLRPDADVWPLLAPRIASPILEGPAVPLANAVLAPYARAVGRVLGRARGAGSGAG